MFTKMLQRRCLSKKITPVRGKLQPISAAGCPEVPFAQPKPKKLSKIPVYPKVRIRKKNFLKSFNLSEKSISLTNSHAGCVRYCLRWRMSL